MGAESYSIISTGRDANEAYQRACEESHDQNGHRDGYSGDIQTSCGFTVFHLPNRMNLKQFYKQLRENWRDEQDERARVQDDIDRGWAKKSTARMPRNRVNPVIKRVQVLVKQVHDTADEKWGSAVCIELRGAEAKATKERFGTPRSRRKVFTFFGMGAS